MYLHGLMAENMKVITMMTRRKVMVCFSGPMAANMTATGKEESKKE